MCGVGSYNNDPTRSIKQHMGHGRERGVLQGRGRGCNGGIDRREINRGKSLGQQLELLVRGRWNKRSRPGGEWMDSKRSTDGLHSNYTSI